MSSLPPISPRLAPTGPQPANAQAVRDARAMFFRALGEVPATPTATPVVPQRPVAPPPPAPAAQASPITAAPPDQPPRRPGSLINILV